MASISLVFMLDKESDAIRRVASKSNASAPITTVMRLHYALEGEAEKTAGWTSVKTSSLRSLAFVRPQKLWSKRFITSFVRVLLHSQRNDVFTNAYRRKSSIREYTYERNFLRNR